MQNFQDVQRAAGALRQAIQAAQGPASLPLGARRLNSNASPEAAAPLGIVLGTGLSSLAEKLLDRVVIPYADLPGFPVSSVEGHAGAFVWGRFPGACGVDDSIGRYALVQQGRCHLYEGRTPAEVCMGVRVMALLGAGTLIITNAAGALNPQFDAGGIMCMSDMINHTGHSPLTGSNYDGWGPRFPDMCAPLDADLRALAQETAQKIGLRLERGVYIGVHGPEMETPAETRMYRQWGADAVGMSTVPEIIVARHGGMRVLGVSCITNMAAGVLDQPLNHEEVMAMGDKVQGTFRALLDGVIEAM